jgi:hypothetical protein
MDRVDLLYIPTRCSREEKYSPTPSKLCTSGP